MRMRRDGKRRCKHDRGQGEPRRLKGASPTVVDEVLDLRGYKIEPTPREEREKRVGREPVLRASEDGRLRQEKGSQRRAKRQPKKQIRLQPIAPSPRRPSPQRASYPIVQPAPEAR